MYERRAEQAGASMRATIASAPDAISGIERIARAGVERRARDDGWLAAFFEFWAHVLRHPELRERFAAVHRQVIEPVIEATERLAAEAGVEPEQSIRRIATAYYAMQLGLQLERLTQPEVVDTELAGHVARRSLEDLVRGGADGRPSPAEASRGRSRRNARGQGARRA